MHRLFKLSAVVLILLVATSTCSFNVQSRAIQNASNVQKQTGSSTLGRVDLKLQAAQDIVLQAFAAVLEAETAGANITSLIALLNNASWLLGQANIAYRIGDLSLAERQAEKGVWNVQDVLAEAQKMQRAATTSAQRAFWLAAVTALFVISVFLLGLFFLWRFFERGYVRSLSKTKPEVAVH
jgi:hypothetical protein